MIGRLRNWAIVVANCWAVSRFLEENIKRKLRELFSLNNRLA
jgi:hypothetical protein